MATDRKGRCFIIIDVSVGYLFKATLIVQSSKKVRSTITSLGGCPWMSCFSRQIVQKPKKCRKAAELLISRRLQHKLDALERKSDINSWMHIHWKQWMTVTLCVTVASVCVGSLFRVSSCRRFRGEEEGRLSCEVIVHLQGLRQQREKVRRTVMRSL